MDPTLAYYQGYYDAYNAVLQTYAASMADPAMAYYAAAAYDPATQAYYQGVYDSCQAMGLC
jgi:hypothetical protein